MADGNDQLRQREAELAQRTRELDDLKRFQDEMLAMLVHDLKSPLAVILASLDYALTHPETGGEVREALEDSHEAATRISRLVGNMLETAQAEAGRLVLRRKEVPLARLIDDALGSRGPLLARRSLALEVDVGQLALHADRDLLARVVENLLDAAVRTAPARGKVKLWASVAPTAIEVRVGTDGTAIPEASRPLVFEKFTQVWDARGGVGLGLYFCRLAVEAHGGKIWIEDTPELPVIIALSLPTA